MPSARGQAAGHAHAVQVFQTSSSPVGLDRAPPWPLTAPMRTAHRFLGPSAAGAPVARGTAAPLSNSTRARAIPPPALTSTVATPWPSPLPWVGTGSAYGWHGARHNDASPGTAPGAGLVPRRCPRGVVARQERPVGCGDVSMTGAPRPLPPGLATGRPWARRWPRPRQPWEAQAGAGQTGERGSPGRWRPRGKRTRGGGEPGAWERQATTRAA
jgi:hypothetical protein